MKVFVSHQKADFALATGIAARLKDGHSIETYLDVIDPNATQAGDALGEYLRAILGKCTQLLAVVSFNTKTSWWVPWEIGIATEKDYPIATFAGDGTSLPEYLKKWPYLKSQEDLDAYATASKQAARTYSLQKSILTEREARGQGTKDFYRTLRARLGQ